MLSPEEETALEYDILSMLFMDAESFATLHGSFIADFGYDEQLDVNDVIEALRLMVDKGWAVMDSPAAPSDRYWKKARREYDEWRRHSRKGVLFSEYGPWFAITDAGRAEWKRREKPS